MMFLLGLARCTSCTHCHRMKPSGIPFAEDPAILDTLRNRIASHDLPQCYFEHSVVAGSTVPIVPLSLYIDGIAYAINDGIIAVWAVNEINDDRHLLCALRKTIRCECGCRGWCTLWSIFDWLRWSFEALANRVYPQQRHDGSAFGTRDDRRKVLAGTEQDCGAALIYIKGDWSELANNFGFPKLERWLAPLLPM